MDGEIIILQDVVIFLSLRLTMSQRDDEEIWLKLLCWLALLQYSGDHFIGSSLSENHELPGFRDPKYIVSL